MAKYEIVSKSYYSNCMAEAIKAKLKKHSVKIYFCKPRITENRHFQMFHFMWSDGKADYDFSDLKENGLPPYKNLFFKGAIRKFELGFAERYCKYRNRKRVQRMAADATTLTEKMRAALRISSTSEKITEEIEDCIAACKADLANDGIKVIDEGDALIVRAITLYCKAEFGYNDKAEEFRQSYDTLKMRLALSQEYNLAPSVSETDTKGAESEA